MLGSTRQRGDAASALAHVSPSGDEAVEEEGVGSVILLFGLVKEEKAEFFHGSLAHPAVEAREQFGDVIGAAFSHRSG